jgi:hypothetical protein
MAGLLDLILKQQDGAVVKQLSNTFGLNQQDAIKAIGSLLPALNQGVKNNISNEDGLGKLLGALKNGQHQQYLDQPEKLGRPETIQDGNSILGHILGSKDVSREVASNAAATTGLDAGILKKMLPVIATMVMGSLSKKSSDMGVLNQVSGGQSVAPSGISGMLVSLLDADKDGSVVDDLLGMAKKLF